MPNTFLISTSELAERQTLSSADDKLVLVDVRTEESYREGHLPGARRLDYANILRSDPPMGGLLPRAADFCEVLRSLGIREDSDVVAYDGEGGAAASRLLWTLNAYGFTQTSLLNGGITTWVSEGRELGTDNPDFPRSTITLTPSGAAVIDVDTLAGRLGDPDLALLDARSLAEFTGEDVRANHGGRIPGAKHVEWTEALDRTNDLKLLPDQALQSMLDKRGITQDKDVVVYCQTHHRSSLSYLMLKHLGYKNVTALDGAWSNWGNRDDTPKETG